MKKTIVAWLLATLPAVLMGQDVLVLQSGDELQARVVEIGLNEIRYKRYDNLEGPVISVRKQDVFMIRYENGTREVFGQAAGKAGDSVPVKTVTERKYKALFCVGASMPVGAFGSKTDDQGGAANTGFFAAHAGDVLLASNFYLNYQVNYTYQPYKLPFYSGYPSSYNLSQLKGHYGMLYLLSGFKIMSNPAPARFYGFFVAGVDFFSVSGDFASFNIDAGGGYSIHATSKGSSAFAFGTGAGVEMNSRIHFGIQYFSAKPEMTGTITATSPYETQSQPLLYEQPAAVMQFFIGVGF